MPQVLDFQKKKPTNNEEFTAILQDIMEKMEFLHKSQLVVMRQLVQKKLMTVEELVEKTHEDLMNQNFVTVITMAEEEFVAKYNNGLKVTYNRSLWHKIKDFFTGTKLTIDVKHNEKDSQEKDPGAGNNPER